MDPYANKPMSKCEYNEQLSEYYSTAATPPSSPELDMLASVATDPLLQLAITMCHKSYKLNSHPVKPRRSAVMLSTKEALQLARLRATKTIRK